MRFSRLHIAAFGPFTDFELSLPAGPADLHLFYGPNEAGKSSLLRAIRGLLFGIPGQSTDNFLHEYKRLRLAADLELPGGQVKRFQRRKGNTNTLLDEHEKPLLDADLKACLGEVDADYFDSMFGLNGESLQSGADALLRGHGRLGEALFSASLGGTPVDVVIRDLETEAAEIFSGKAQRRLRQSLRAHAELSRARREALVKPEDWEDLEKRQQEVDTRLADLRSRRHTLTQRKLWLERCRDALDSVGRLRENEMQLAALPRPEGLPASFATDLLALRSSIRTKQQEFQQLEVERGAIREQIAGCTPDQTLLARESAIEGIHTQFAVYAGTKEALSAKQAEAATIRQTIDALGKDLGVTQAFENLESLRLNRLQYSEAQEEARKLEEASETLAHSEKRIAELTRNIERRIGSRIEVDETRLAALKTLHEQAVVLMDRAAGLPARRQTLQLRKHSLATRHLELPGAPSGYQQTSDLAVPPKATLERFRLRWEESERDLRSCHDTLQRFLEQETDQKAEIKNLMQLRDIPDPQRLVDARAHRDRGWQLVLNEWKGAGAREDLVPGQPLHEAYPEAVHAADQIADRLRLEADAVAKVEEKRLQLEGIEDKRRAQEAHLTSLRQQEQALREEWAKAWQPCGVPPQSPSEMLAWREAWQEFRRAWNELEADRQALAEDEVSVESTRSAMAEVLGEGPERGFAELRHRLDEELKRSQEARARQLADEQRDHEDQEELAAATESLVAKRATLEAARTRWQNLAVTLAIPEEFSPRRAMEFLEGRRELFQEYDRLQSLMTTCGQLESFIEGFEASVHQAAQGTEWAGAAIEVVAHSLWKGLEAAQKAHQQLESLRQSETEKTHLLQQRNLELKSLEEDFAARCRHANLEEDAAVDAFAADCETARDRQRSITQFRESLAGLARGESVDAFIARVSAEDAGSLEGELDRLANDLADLEKHLEESADEKRDIATQMAALEKAGDAAARCDQLAQLEEARMLADARRFVELQTAISLLKGQIDRFREQNQGPFLNAASRWFSLLTGASFDRLTASFTDGDEPTIVGRRRGASADTEVPVSGMSEGTRDQLYLALRLAGWEQHLQEHPPMPLILDDLLVHFDDARAAHALRALGEMSRKCQVLLFTHHHHLLDLARQSLDPGGFTVHSIQAGVATPASQHPTDTIA